MRRNIAWLGFAPLAALLALTAWTAANGNDERSAERIAKTVWQADHGLIGSKHDFTEQGAFTSDLCLPCHAPHMTSQDAALLTRDVPNESRQGRSTERVVFDASSLLCLSCHDGITAQDVYATTHAAIGITLTDRSRLTTHPVGVRYRPTDPRYHSAAAVQQTLPLPGGRIQCVTCHDPHNTGRHPGMLVISNDRSRLCLTCHRL